MQASDFHESNATMDTPRDADPDEVKPLRVWKGEGAEGAYQTISCFKPTQDEIDEVQRTGRVWLHILGQGMPPVYLGARNPFTAKGPQRMVPTEPLEVDPLRAGNPPVGVEVQAMHDGVWGPNDIAHLTPASFLRWLRYGGRSRAEQLLGRLLGFGDLHKAARRG